MAEHPKTNCQLSSTRTAGKLMPTGCRLGQKWLMFLLVGGALACPAQSPALSPLQLEVTSNWTDNISRTSHLPTKKSGQYYLVRGNMDYMRQLDRDWMLLGIGEITGQVVPDFTALNNLTARGQMLLRRKFGLGAMAPVVELHAALSLAEFSESGRSGWQYEGGGRVAKRFTSSLSFNTGADLSEFFAHHPVFDVSTRRVYLEGNWDITNRWRLNLGGSRIWGEFVANAAPNIWPLAIGGQLGPEIFAHYNTLAWEVSDTFGPGWVAYRNRDSEANMWWVELCPAISAQTSLTLRYEFVRAANAIGIEYDSNTWTLGLNHQF